MMKLMALVVVIFVSVACGSRVDRRESTQAPRPTPHAAEARCEESGGKWEESGGISSCELPESITEKTKEPVYQQPSTPAESEPTQSDEVAPADSYSVAYKLAVVHGDPSSEPEFQRVLDCVQASGIEGGETEEQIGDTLVASWQASGKADTLLEWAQVFC